MTILPFPVFQGLEHRPFSLMGGKPAALLVHGFPGTPAEMRPLAEALNAAGWTVGVPLLPGFGPDIESLPARRMEDWAATVRLNLLELQRQHAPVLLLGISLGGALSIQLGAQLKPDGVVLLSPFWRIRMWLWSAMPLLRWLLPSVQPFKLYPVDFNDPELRRGVADFLPGIDLNDLQVQAAFKEFRVPVGMFNELRRSGEAAYRLAESLSAPALVLQGVRDPLVQPSDTQRMIARFNGPVQYIDLPAEHNLLRTEQPAWPQVLQAVMDFAARFA